MPGRALLMIHTNKPPRTAAVRSPTGTEISNASLSVSNSSSPPNASATTPPAARAPWLITNASAANSPNASTISSSPATLIGSCAKSEQRQDQRDRAEARRAGSMPGLNSSNPMPDQAERQEQEHRVGVHQQLQRLELQRHVDGSRSARRSSRGAGALGPLTWNPSSSRTRSSCVLGHDVHEVCARAPRSPVTFTASRTISLGEVAVAAVPLRERAHVGRRVVADLAAQHLVLLTAAERDRGGRADVRLAVPSRRRPRPR